MDLSNKTIHGYSVGKFHMSNAWTRHRLSTYVYKYLRKSDESIGLSCNLAIVPHWIRFRLVFVLWQLQCDETIKLSLITISRLDHARKVHSSVHQKCKSQSNSNPMLSKLLMLWHDRIRWQGFYQTMKFSVFFDSQINLLHAIIITNHIKVISRKFKPIR